MDRCSISRRQWLWSIAAGGVSLLPGCAQPARIASVPDDDVHSLAARVDRITWGANGSSIARARDQGFEAFLGAQLRPSPARMPAALEARIAQMTISREPMEALVLQMEDKRKGVAAAGTEDARKAAQQDYQQELNRLSREAASRHVLRALYSPDQVLEQMCWFWLDHFSVHQYKHDLRAMLGDYEDTLRTHALGRFRDLLGAVAHHPAMLRYLDNDRNAAGHINENYARELMELHTLGVDGGYAQADVQELARVLTGVGVNVTGATPRVRRELQELYVRRGLFEFNPNRHDFGPKQLLGRPIASRGLAELDEALDRLARHPATARFVSRKLALFWMSDDPPASVVDRMARAFITHDGEIAGVLRAMFEQPEFWSARKFKDPMRYVMSAVRLAYDERPIVNPGPVLAWLARMGEPLYGHQTPDGYPLDSRAWSSAGQMVTRFEIAKAIGSGSAGLFRSEEPGDVGQRIVAQAPAPLRDSWRAAMLGNATRTALAQAASPQEWNTFLLSSPEFMQR